MYGFDQDAVCESVEANPKVKGKYRQ